MKIIECNYYDIWKKCLLDACPKSEGNICCMTCKSESLCDYKCNFCKEGDQQ